MKKIFIAILLILPLSLIKAQGVLNIKGKEYISLSGQYLPGQYAGEVGYNKYLSSRSVYAVHARYLKEDINYTSVNTGLAVVTYSKKIFSPGEKWSVFGYGSANLGIEHHSSSVEDESKTRWVFGGSLGLYSEIQINDNLALSISGDLNGRYRSLVSTTYYTLRFGINYYLR